jgi:hypothetical protein
LAKESFEQVFSTPDKREKTLLFTLPDLVSVSQYLLDKAVTTLNMLKIVVGLQPLQPNPSATDGSKHRRRY